MTACPLQAARPLLCPQRSDGGDQNSVLTRIAVVSDTGENHEERRFSHGLGAVGGNVDSASAAFVPWGGCPVSALMPRYAALIPRGRKIAPAGDAFVPLPAELVLS